MYTYVQTLSLLDLLPILNALLNGWLGVVDKASIVVTKRPSIAVREVAHERVATPSTMTVHAPQLTSSQPYLLPVRLDASRNAHSSGVLGSSRYSTGLPFTVKRVMAAVIAAPYRLWNCARFSLPECW